MMAIETYGDLDKELIALLKEQGLLICQIRVNFTMQDKFGFALSALIEKPATEDVGESVFTLNATSPTMLDAKQWRDKLISELKSKPYQWPEFDEQARAFTVKSGSLYEYLKTETEIPKKYSEVLAAVEALNGLKWSWCDCCVPPAGYDTQIAKIETILENYKILIGMPAYLSDKSTYRIKESTP